jgi:aerobic carbon-monoxide dehydrogenase medium subunit
VKAPSFAYAKPATLAEALQLLGRPGAKVLAGGQSLIPSLNLRLSSPELLVDITGLPGLSDIRVSNGTLRIGALVTHARLEKSPEVKAHAPLLAEAVPHVGHTAIRNRGTIGGSLALADPAAEYPACAVALNAVLFIKDKTSQRRVAAEKFFKGLFETDLKPGEILVAVEFPKQRGKHAFLELARRHGDYAIVGVAALESRFVFFGVGTKPVAVDSKEQLKKIQPAADLYHSPATKLHLAGVLLERAWNTLSTSR